MYCTTLLYVIVVTSAYTLMRGEAVPQDTCAIYCGNNNNCEQKHYCSVRCSTDMDCDPLGTKDSCATCDEAMKTCRPARNPAWCNVTTNFTSIPATQIMEDFWVYNGLPDIETCLSNCCPLDTCAAVTWVKASWGTLCYLHNHTDKQNPNPDTTVYLRKNNLPPEDNTHCPRCDLLDGQCSQGYGCGCPCAVDSDCDNYAFPSSCSMCVGRSASGLGLCGGGPSAPDEKCVPPYPGQPHKNCSEMMDLIFLLDGSGSITDPDWVLVKKFTMQIGLNFTTAPILMQYAIIQFSDSASTFMHLTTGNSTFQLVMNTMWKFSQSTNTGDGLNLVAQEFNTNGRPGAYKVVVIITDGLWNTGPDPIPIATELRNNGTHIYGIAVGGADIQNVQELCSPPLSFYYYNVTTESQLPIILHDLVNNMCTRCCKGGDEAHLSNLLSKIS